MRLSSALRVPRLALAALAGCLAASLLAPGCGDATTEPAPAGDGGPEVQLTDGRRAEPAPTGVTAAEEPAAPQDSHADAGHTAGAAHAPAGAGSAASTGELSALPEGRGVETEDPLADELRHVDPTLAGWDTEALERAASARLSAVGALLAAEAPPTAEDVAPWLTADAWCTTLRPPAAGTRFDDGHLRVSPGAPVNDRREGAEGLAAALGELHAALHATGAEPHLKAKVISVDPRDARQVGTTVLVQTWALGDRRLQRDDTWQVEWEQPAPDAEPLLASLRLVEGTEVTGDGPLFTDCTEAVLGETPVWSEQLLTGADAWCARVDVAAGMSQYGHNGLVVGDFDEDGREDVYVLQAGGLPNRLFLQQPDGTTREAAAELGLDFLEDNRAALLLDLDEDGRKELVLTARRSVLVLDREGDGPFQVVEELALLGGYSVAAADYDGDGLVDLYVCSYLQSTEDVLPTPYHDARNGPPNALFRNLGGLRFLNTTHSTGLGEGNHRFSFAAAWADYDEDGDQDLYVANDFGRNNLYRQGDDGRFTDVAGEAGVEDMAAGMGASWSDYDGDGDLDLYVSNMFSSAGRRIAYQRRFQEGADEATRSAFQRHARGNSLFRNEGDGRFRDVTEPSRTWFGRWAWGAQFVDLTGDGRDDLFVPNGFFTNQVTTDL